MTPPLKLYLNPPPGKGGWYTVVYTGSFHIAYAEDGNGQLTKVTVRQDGVAQDFPTSERNRQAIKAWQKLAVPEYI